MDDQEKQTESKDYRPLLYWLAFGVLALVVLVLLISTLSSDYLVEAPLPRPVPMPIESPAY